MELLEDVVVIGSGDSFGKADGRLDVGLQGSFQHLIHLAVVVVIVTDAKHALNVIPNGRAEA